ncbi:MAG: hypothetical protein IJ837_03945 [Clostridia bacterium]|nr:hypothetical protein [Clostridia bacterium]
MLMLSEKNELLRLNITAEELNAGKLFYNLQLVNDKNEEIGYCNFVKYNKDVWGNKRDVVWIYKIEVNDKENRGKAYGKALIDVTEYFALTQLSIDRIEGKFAPNKDWYEKVEKFYLRNNYDIVDIDDWGHYAILKNLDKKIVDEKTGRITNRKQEIIERVSSKIIEPPKVKIISLEDKKEQIQKIQVIEKGASLCKTENVTPSDKLSGGAESAKKEPCL